MSGDSKVTVIPAQAGIHAPARYEPRDSRLRGNDKILNSVALIICFSVNLLPASLSAAPHPYLVLYGEPKYAPGFSHFDYTDPAAPKGGEAKLYVPGTFDSLNPFILKGTPMPAVGGYVFETLMTPSLDEPQSDYPLIAKTVDLSDDRKTATFALDPRARFSDGTKITAEDVLFSLETLKTKADPQYQMVYKGMSATAPDARTVRFTFDDPTNRDLPYQAAGMPILSKAYYTAHDFEKTSLEAPLGSGPYRVSNIDPGRSIEFTRNPDYWAKDLPSRRGMFNFETIHFDVYRDETVALEGFKAHAYDLREEYISRNWANAYKFPAVERGEVKLYAAPDLRPKGMQAFIYNQRRDKFADPRVREAIGLTLDFEWMNHALFYDAYERDVSFFQNTEFAARDAPSPAEIALLEPYRSTLPPELFTAPYTPPKSDGSGNIRPQLIRAQKLLDEAGWVIKDGRRVNAKTGQPLTIEFMDHQSTYQRVVLPMIRNLSRLGIEAHFRLVDDSQFQKRLQSKDFDITTIWWNLGVPYPGYEQAAYWSSAQADVAGSQNLSGARDPAIDACLKALLAAKDKEALLTAARALDRVLLWRQMVIPHWSITHFRTAYWDRFGLPAVHPIYGLGFDSWWVKDGK